MSNEDEFYIGWQDKMPQSIGSFLKKRMLVLLLLLPILALTLVLLQRHFNKGAFQIGTLTELTGTYITDPIPMLMNAELPGSGQQEDILLVGYGKFGAEGIITQIESDSGSIDNKAVTLIGTLVTGGDKTVLELTNKKESLVSIGVETLLAPQTVLLDSSVMLSGEILDPKCYFGAMKPGEGKIHKSCAIRCISGGIPPVFRSGRVGAYEYYILLNEKGASCNKEVLSYVGEQVSMSGRTYQLNSWKVLHADLASVKPKE